MSDSGFSLETATRQMGLRMEWVVLIVVMRVVIEVREERRWAVRVAVGVIAEASSEEGAIAEC